MQMAVTQILFIEKSHYRSLKENLLTYRKKNNGMFSGFISPFSFFLCVFIAYTDIDY